MARDMFGRAAAALALAVCLLGGGWVQAQVLQLDISADFNADVVVNDGSDSPDVGRSNSVATLVTSNLPRGVAT